ncbi:TadE/TadG family type IV pilus assembly protein [Streptomyces sp. BR123]|uniref:TadE/TadG family type IV pilus assembly protein n=1 Tax=Streptomyces sp. BR123 TaxID=2749828 RepID=UPI002810C9FD|nr:TadE/TadG family type IV pilus assembly protein [Streptomyces sp. BR123]
MTAPVGGGRRDRRACLRTAGDPDVRPGRERRPAPAVGMGPAPAHRAEGNTPDPGCPGRGPGHHHRRHGGANRQAGRRLRMPRGDRGQVALEYIGFIPVLLFVALCGIQLGWVAYVHEQADTAARTAARVEARKPGAGAAAGHAAIRSGLDATIDVGPSGADAVTATVTITVRSIVPGLGLDPARATAVMPNDDPDPDRDLKGSRP